MVTTIATMIVVLFASASIPPGIAALSQTFTPLSIGFSKGLHMQMKNADILSLPLLFMHVFGFVFAYGRLMSCMARSCLLPTILTWSFGARETPIFALVIGSALIFFILLSIHDNETVIASLNATARLASYTCYVGLLASFIMLRVKFPNMERYFRNPFGISGAVYSLLIAILGMFGTLLFDKTLDKVQTVYIFFGFLVICSLYYFTVAYRRQKYSTEEMKALFTLHVAIGK